MWDTLVVTSVSRVALNTAFDTRTWRSKDRTSTSSKTELALGILALGISDTLLQPSEQGAGGVLVLDNGLAA